MIRYFAFTSLVACLFIAPIDQTIGEETDPIIKGPETCARIENADLRLVCYDVLFRPVAGLETSDQNTITDDDLRSQFERMSDIVDQALGVDGTGN